MLVFLGCACYLLVVSLGVVALPFFMSLLSWFLYCLCAAMFSCVGFDIRRSCSLCCFAIRFFMLALHHAFLGRFGMISYFSMTCFIDC